VPASEAGTWDAAHHGVPASPTVAGSGRSCWKGRSAISCDSVVSKSKPRPLELSSAVATPPPYDAAGTDSGRYSKSVSYGVSSVDIAKSAR
jgi:hypothetical protein